MIIELNRHEINVNIDSLDSSVINVTNTTWDDFEFEYNTSSWKELFLIKKWETKTYSAKVWLVAARWIAERKLSLENLSFVHRKFVEYFTECIWKKSIDFKSMSYDDLKEMSKEKWIEIAEENWKLKKKDKLIKELEETNNN